MTESRVQRNSFTSDHDRQQTRETKFFTFSTVKLHHIHYDNALNAVKISNNQCNINITLYYSLC